MQSDAMLIEPHSFDSVLSRREFIQAVCRQMDSSPLVSVLIANLDRFHLVNENFAYTVGDAILDEKMRRLSSSIPANAFFGRISGDEFAVALFGHSEPDVAEIVTALHTSLCAPHIAHDTEILVTVSIGYAVNDGSLACQELLRRADLALHQAKDLGRNQVHVAKDVEAQTIPPLVMEAMLRQAIANRDLSIYYQPKIMAKSMQVVGAEALCRWRHPVYGQISPQQFIPVAESSDLILPIDEYVLREVCQQAAEWANQGHRIRTSVNVSSRQFGHPNFTQLVKDVLIDTGLDASLIELEITERTAMQDIDKAVQVLHELRNMGIRIAIDDFGIGYSSLSYLMRFPVHTIKIDRSFTSGIQSTVNQIPVVGAIISLAKSLNLNVVAEGIETMQQFHFLRDHHCDEIQGYLFGEPVPAANFQFSTFSFGPILRTESAAAYNHTTIVSQISEYEWIERIGMAAQRQPNLKNLLTTLASFCIEEIPFDRFSFEFAGPLDEFCIVHEASVRDDVPARTAGTLIPVHHSGIELVRKTRLPRSSPDVLHQPVCVEDYNLGAMGIRSILRVPLLRGQEVYGMFTVQSTQPNAYNEHDRRILARLATRLSDTVYSAFQDAYVCKIAEFDKATNCFSISFLSQLLEHDSPHIMLSRACQRPFFATTDCSVIYIGLQGMEDQPPTEVEFAFRFLAQLVTPFIQGESVAIRVSDCAMIVLLFGDEGLSKKVRLTHVLAQQFTLWKQREQRLTSDRVAVDVRIGYAYGAWKEFDRLYVYAKKEAHQNAPLCSENDRLSYW